MTRTELINGQQNPTSGETSLPDVRIIERATGAEKALLEQKAYHLVSGGYTDASFAELAEVMVKLVGGKEVGGVQTSDAYYDKDRFYRFIRTVEGTREDSAAIETGRFQDPEPRVVTRFTGGKQHGFVNPETGYQTPFMSYLFECRDVLTPAITPPEAMKNFAFTLKIRTAYEAYKAYAAE